jgi:hypothetical protein
MKEITLKSAGAWTVSSCITFFVENSVFDILRRIKCEATSRSKGAMPILQFFSGSRPVSRARFNPSADPPILSRHTYHSLQCTAQWDRHRKKKTSRRAGRDRSARHTPGMKYLLSDNNLEPADNKDSRVLYKLPGPTLDYPPVCVRNACRFLS